MKYTYHCKEYIEQLKLNNELGILTDKQLEINHYNELLESLSFLL